MLIETDIIIRDENGREHPTAVATPQELLRLMQDEGVKTCYADVKVMGRQLLEHHKLTLDDVERWVKTNDIISVKEARADAT